MKQDDGFVLSRLRFIRDRYGALIQASAARHNHRPEVVAGIMMRETEGGLSKWCNRPGPACRGDDGHGHGLMQIDDRSFPEYCAGSEWQDPASNIDFGCRVLADKRSYLQSHLPGGSELERASVAAYNCGERNVWQVVECGEDLDARTTGHDYSRSVLAFAAQYRELSDAVPQEAAVGFWGNLLALLMKIFVRHK